VTSPVTVRGRRPVRRTELVGVALTVLLGIAAIVAMASALRVPAHVDEVTFDNPHEWPATIRATDGEADGWHGIGVVDRETEHTFQEIIDQGDTWVFRFSYAGEVAEVRVSGAQLAEDRWQLRVPDEFADALRAAGVEPPPR
jgi:hypothetical protein